MNYDLSGMRNTVQSGKDILQEISEAQHALVHLLFSAPRRYESIWREWSAQFDPTSCSYATTRMLTYLAHQVRQEAPERVDSRLESMYLTSLANALLLLDRSLPVVQKLQSCGLQPFVMKGLPLLQCYPSVGCRPMGDIDIYVAPNALSATLELLEDEGFYQDEIGWSLAEGLESYHSTLFRHDNGAAIDLHWHVFYECSQLQVDALYFAQPREITIDGLSFRTASPSALFLHVCVNGLRPGPSPSLYWVLDAMLLAEQEQWNFDWEYVAELAQRAACLACYREALNYISKCCGKEVIPEVAFSALTRRTPILLERVRVRLEEKAIENDKGGLWYRLHHYYRKNESQGYVKDTIGFILHLKEYWGLESVPSLVVKLCSVGMQKMLRRLRSVFGKSN